MERVKTAERRGQRPCFKDGLMSSLTYLIVASKPPSEAEQYNALGVRLIGSGWYRVHAYPNLEAFSLGDLKYDGINTGYFYHNDKHGYDSVQVERSRLTTMLDQLSKQRGVVVAPVEHVLEVLNRGFDPNSDATEPGVGPRPIVAEQPAIPAFA
jgi:hypothetical protein